MEKNKYKFSTKIQQLAKDIKEIKKREDEIENRINDLFEEIILSGSSKAGYLAAKKLKDVLEENEYNSNILLLALNNIIDTYELKLRSPQSDE